MHSTKEAPKTGIKVQFTTPLPPFNLEGDKKDHIVTSRGVGTMDEYSRPKQGYEAIIGIPAAFTPVCASEMAQLDKLFDYEWPDGVEVTITVVMLDRPHAVSAWLQELKLNNVMVTVSEEAASIHDLTNYNDHARPILRAMAVTYNEQQQMSVGDSILNFMGPLMCTKAIELTRTINHMDIPRNFDEVIRVIEHHHENRI